MHNRHLVTLPIAALFILIVGALAGIKVLQIRAMIQGGGGGMPPTTVSAAEIVEDVWEMTIPAVGSVTAYQGILVANEVAGTISEIHFRPGAEVAAGDLLVQFEDSVERANLQQAQAELELAEKTAARSRELRSRNSIPQSELDAAEASVAASEAAVAALRAQLEKKRIVAPFAGRLGIRQINVGQYLSPGSPLVDLRSISPIFVEFSLPQSQLSNLKEGYTVRIVEGAAETAPGEITAINSLINPVTRNVAVQATFENADAALRPGMYVRAEVLLPEAREVRMIPQTAVIYAAYGDSVFVVEEGEDGGLIAQQAFVRLGERRGDFVEVLSGLEPGQRIVRAGAFKLRNGAPIVLSDVGVEDATLSPTPRDS